MSATPKSFLATIFVCFIVLSWGCGANEIRRDDFGNAIQSDDDDASAAGGDAGKKDGPDDKSSLGDDEPSINLTKAEDPYLLKGLHHIFYASQNAQGITGNPYSEVLNSKTGRMVILVPWDLWEPSQEAPAAVGNGKYACASGKFNYENQACYSIENHVDQAITAYSTQQNPIEVTIIIARVPTWARIANCTLSSGVEFCAPREDALPAFSRFTKMLATRYGQKVKYFIVGNEVNSGVWYNVGTNNTVIRAQSYAKYFTAAHDALKEVAPQSRVLIPTTHAFRVATFPRDTRDIGVEAFLPEVTSRLRADIKWSIAYHPYPADMVNPSQNVDDYDLGVVSTANLGILEAWLLKQYPNQPLAQEIFLTESGINRVNESDQANQVCDSYRAVVGTPHVKHYFYYSYEDNPSDLSFGFVRFNGAGVPLTRFLSWNVYSRSNQWEKGLASCGFETLGLDRYYTHLKRGFHATRGHWFTSRILPTGFTQEASWLIERQPREDGSTRALYECAKPSGSTWNTAHSFPSFDIDCELSGTKNMGVLGYISANRLHPDQVLLSRCSMPNNSDHVVLANVPCAAIGWGDELSLGYAFVPENSAPTPTGYFSMHRHRVFYSADGQNFCRAKSRDSDAAILDTNINRWPAMVYTGDCR